MAATIVLTGWEHAFAGSLLPPAAGAWPFWAATNTGSYVVDAPPTSPGTRCYQIVNTSGQKFEVHADCFPASTRSIAVRLYFKFTTLPTADVNEFLFFDVTNSDAFIGFDVTTGKIAYGWTGTPQAQTCGPVLVADQWYRLDAKVDTSANPKTMTVSVDGIEGSAATIAEVANDINSITIGSSTSVTNGGTVRVDDLRITASAADYPLGVGGVAAVAPTADGTHVNASRFQDDGSTAISGGNPAYTRLDEIPMAGTADASDYVKQVTLDGVGEDSYVEVTGFSGPARPPNAVCALVTFRASATQANTAAVTARNSAGTEVNVHGSAATPVDVSETTVMCGWGIVTEPGGGWTAAEVSAVKMRLGYSTDVTPNPWFMGAILEVDYALGTPPLPRLQLHLIHLRDNK